MSVCPKYAEALREISLYLSINNQNVLDGDLVASIRDLACRAQDINTELLAACKLAEWAFRVPAGTRLDGELQALEMIRAAIAKAEAQ